MSKTVLITGVTGGIGTALAEAFHDDGWSVLGTGRSDKACPSCNAYFRCDISSYEEVASMALAIKKRYGSLNCIINNASVQLAKPLVDTTVEEWHAVIETNVSALFYMAKSFHDQLDEGGSIINISSVHARATSKGMAAYVTSKGAQTAFTRALALELADKKIRVNAIMPGAIATPMLKESLDRSGNPELSRNNLIRMTPLKRIGKPEEIAALALFLADTEKAGYITGQEFVCDGGVLAQLASETD